MALSAAGCVPDLTAQTSELRAGDEALDAARQADLLPGIGMGKGLTVDAPIVVDNLAVFPVYASFPIEDVGQFGALHQKIAAGDAEVREVSKGPNGAEVNGLQYENRTALPVLALGGTVFEGGFQDRMITRDIIMPPTTTDQLAVHCAEKSRWSPMRAGTNTRGKFGVLGTFAGTALRATGEILGKQHMVWKRVAQVNANHCKAPATGTLAAVLDDPAMKRERQAVAAKVGAFLDAQQHQDNLVGVAYAINGAVRHVRMFANGPLFQQFRGHLGRSAAYEALAEQGAAKRTPKDAHLRIGHGELTPEGAVAHFVREIRESPDGVEERPMGKATKTVYLHGGRGYGAIAVWQPSEASEREVPLTASYISKSYIDAAERTYASCSGS